MFEAVELLGSCLPVTPVYRVLCADASRARIVEAHDQLIGIGVTDLGRDLVELATLHHREIDVEVDPGKWVRVRPDGPVAPASPPGTAGFNAVLQRTGQRRRVGRVNAASTARTI